MALKLCLGLLLGVSTLTSSSAAKVGLSKSRYLLQFDGGSRGNPGLGGAGAVIYDISKAREEIWSSFWYLGEVTNNQAEYTGLIKGLQHSLKNDLYPVEVEGDSQLVLFQCTGKYKCQSENLKALNKMATKLLAQYPKEHQPSLSHIPRKENARADELSNAAMDAGQILEKEKTKE